MKNGRPESPTDAGIDNILGLVPDEFFDALEQFLWAEGLSDVIIDFSDMQSQDLVDRLGFVAPLNDVPATAVIGGWGVMAKS